MPKKRFEVVLNYDYMSINWPDIAAEMSIGAPFLYGEPWRR